jgi:hypothetical protein
MMGASKLQQQYYNMQNAPAHHIYLSQLNVGGINHTFVIEGIELNDITILIRTLSLYNFSSLFFVDRNFITI